MTENTNLEGTQILQRTSGYWRPTTIRQNIEGDEQRLSTNLASLLIASQESLESAQSLIDGIVQDEMIRTIKSQVKVLLEPIQPVMSLLDAVSQIHPAIGAAAGAYKVIVQLYVDRLGNERKIAVIFYQISDLMFQLGYLDPVFSQDDGLKGLLQKNLDSISNNINMFGNFCDLYYKHKSFVRTILSARYKGKLGEIATSFSELKDNLVVLLQQRIAVDVSSTKLGVSATSDKLDKLYVLVESLTREETETHKIVDQNGGLDTILNDSESLRRVAHALGEELTPSLRLSMVSDLDVMLDANIELYNLKIDAAVEKMTEAIEHSTSAILLRLDAGTHELIEDTDIQEIWKLNNWGMSCKLREFCGAMHLHFRHKFAVHLRETNEVHPDAWTLSIMSRVIFYAAIGDAIDDDNSGYLSVPEVNRFFKYKPQGWSSPEMVAFWAIGWYKNHVSYKAECDRLLDELIDACSEVRIENYPAVKRLYFDNVIEDIGLVIHSFHTNTLTYLGQTSLATNPRFQTIRHHYMEQEMARLERQLARPKYRIDDIQEVYGICGSQRIEHTFLIVLYLVMKRHIAILEVARTKVLREEEFETMAITVGSLMGAFNERLNVLQECWRQQKLDVWLQVQRYASGLFQAWWSYEDDPEENTSESESESEEDEEQQQPEEVDWDGEDDSAFFQDFQGRLTPSLCVHSVPEQPEELPEPSEGARDEMEKTMKTYTAQVSNKQLRRRLVAVETKLEIVENRLDTMTSLLEKILAVATKESS